MMLHKLRIALAVTLLALAAVSVVDSGSAQGRTSFLGPQSQTFFLDLGPAGGWDGGFGP
jgi:hypothetical protein